MQTRMSKGSTVVVHESGNPSPHHQGPLFELDLLPENDIGVEKDQGLSRRRDTDCPSNEFVVRHLVLDLVKRRAALDGTLPNLVPHAGHAGVIENVHFGVRIA
jgi:hypothetical protein